MKNKLRKKNIFTLGNRYRNNIGFRHISSRDNCATIKNGKMMLFTKSSNCRSIKNEYAIRFPISVSVYEDFTDVKSFISVISELENEENSTEH